MKIGFTGTQEGMTSKQKYCLGKFLDLKDNVEFHHGDCIGADAEAHEIAVLLGFDTVLHPPVVKSKRAFCIGTRSESPLPYLDRNKNIVDAVAMMIATPKEKDEQIRSGTWSTIRYAKKQKKTILVLFPDGTGKWFLT